jgi:hypothetical protein
MTIQVAPDTARVIEAFVDGQRVVLAQRDVAGERDRWWELARIDGRWRCPCPLFRLAGGCPHAAEVVRRYDGAT